MITEPGTRVIALACADPETMAIDVYGAGVYAGEFPRPGYEGVPAEGSEEYEYWAAVIRRNDLARTSVQWSLDEHKRRLDDGECDQAEYEQRCIEVQEVDRLIREIPMAERVADVYEAIASNPRIDLDEGGSVWGFECWWAREDVVREKYAGWTWAPRSIEDDRIKYT
jgi:hypothetical protein